MYAAHHASIVEAIPMPSRRPWILTLDVNGRPHRWVSWQAACTYHARDMVAWSTGELAVHVLGGTCRLTGERSSISTQSIIAIKGRALRPASFRQVPPLSNRELFRRDRHTCAYCGSTLSGAQLTRDHIEPVSRGGKDIWMNVVTACRHCNQKKDNRRPEQAGMALLYTPYVPNKAEFLILSNRNILADQMDFLLQHLPQQSRARELDA